MPDIASDLSNTPRRGTALVVMGVSGCGKSSMAAALAQALQWTMVEGDDFHSVASKLKMRQGQALDDADRAGWLDTLGQQLQRHPQGVVLSCSALKRAYRDRLRAACPGLLFAYLQLSQEHATARVQARASTHFFNPALVQSQFATLEEPTGEKGVFVLDALLPVHTLCDTTLAWLATT